MALRQTLYGVRWSLVQSWSRVWPVGGTRSFVFRLVGEVIRKKRPRKTVTESATDK
jgi:hypothetical protein